MIGYFTNQYPKVSHSFIRREIAALERLGHPVRRYALRGWDGDAVDAADLGEIGKTAYLLRRTAPMIAALVWLAVTRPGGTIRAMRLLARFIHRSDRSAGRHVVGLAEAALLACWLRRDGITHLHVHFGTNPAEVATLAQCWAGVPFSFTVHGPDEFDRPEATKLGLKVAAAAFVVAITDFCASQIYRWCDLADWPKIQVVRCGLDASFLAAAPPPLPRTARLVCVARLSAQKGHLLLIAAMAELHRRGRVLDLVLVGDGELRPAVDAAIARHGLADRVTVTGWVDEAAVRAALTEARGFILPSFAEGLPIVIMEALALGRPVLASNVAAVSELVETGDTGWLFAPGSVDAIVTAVEQWLDADQATLVATGARGRDRVLARHDADMVAKQLAALIQGATI